MRHMNLVTAAGQPATRGGLAGTHLGQSFFDSLFGAPDPSQTYSTLPPAERSDVDRLLTAGLPLADALIRLALDEPANPYYSPYAPYASGGINPATGMPYGYPTAQTGSFMGLSVPMLLLLGVGGFLLYNMSRGRR